MNVVKIFGAILLVGSASTAKAAVDFDQIPLSELMATCSSAESGSQAQLECFTVLSERIKEQGGTQGSSANADSPIVKSLEALRTVAEYQDAETGLSISGSGCVISVFYYGNHYRISRRNISAIDLFSVQFNASKLQYDQTTQVQSSVLSRVRGVMENGSTATSKGGAALESAVHNFEPMSANTSVGDYAVTVESQLSAQQEQTFEFVLVHPQRAPVTNDIFSAFASFVQACKS